MNGDEWIKSYYRSYWVFIRVSVHPIMVVPINVKQQCHLVAVTDNNDHQSCQKRVSIIKLSSHFSHDTNQKTPSQWKLNNDQCTDGISLSSAIAFIHILYIEYYIEFIYRVYIEFMSLHPSNIRSSSLVTSFSLTQLVKLVFFLSFYSPFISTHSSSLDSHLLKNWSNGVVSWLVDSRQ